MLLLIVCCWKHSSLSDDCLNDGSRGRRPFTSLSALLYMCERSLCLVSRWTESILDESILTDRRRRVLQDQLFYKDVQQN